MATDSNKKIVVTGRSLVILISDENGIEKSQNKVPYGAQLFCKEGDVIKRGQRLASWDPYTRPILADVAGKVDFGDLVDGISIDERLDESTGISQRVVIDWRGSSRGNDLQPSVILSSAGLKPKTKNEEQSDNRRYSLPVNAILSVEKDIEVSAGDVLARVPTDSAKTKDITGGLPRVAELFEARKAKDSAIIAENDGQVVFGKEVRGKQRVSIVPEDGAEASNYLIPKGKHINFNPGERIQKGEYLLDGQPLPHDILRIMGIKDLTEYFVNQVQEVYRLQGVIINDKHIETILRQMLKKVEVKTTGDSTYLPGEIIDRIKFDNVNEKLKSEGKTPATGERVLMGITKASLQTESFISAASFQETTRVLTDAAIKGKIDPLNGLKENVIVGRLVPAGTGNIKNKWNKKALEDDNKFLSEQEKIEPSESPTNQ